MTRPAIATFLPPRCEDERVHDAWLYWMQKSQRVTYAADVYAEATPRERPAAKAALDHAELMLCGAVQAFLDEVRDAELRAGGMKPAA